MLTPTIESQSDILVIRHDHEPIAVLVIVFGLYGSVVTKLAADREFPSDLGDDGIISYI